METIEKLIDRNTFDSKPIPNKFEWKNVNVCVGDKILLDSVSGKLYAGQSLAIVGPSGSGKTTLLNFLAKKKMTGAKQFGEIYFNNELIKSSTKYKKLISYVMQDDVLEESLTPLEILMFTAKIRINESQNFIEEKVSSLISQLGIEKCKNTIVGGIMNKGISGGEKRRVSIAAELLNDSAIIILDEPTSGLDSQTAFELISTLNEIKNSGKIIIFTIHQPSSEIYSLLNRILILVKGSKVFMKDKSELSTFFSNKNLHIPQYYNQFEYILEVTTISAVTNNTVIEAYPELASYTNKEEAYTHYISILCRNSFSLREESLNLNFDEGQDFEVTSSTSWFNQIYILFLKFLIIGFRNPKHFRFKMIQFLILGLIMSLLFFQIRFDEVGTKSKLGFLMYTAVSIVFNSTSSAVLICNFNF